MSSNRRFGNAAEAFAAAKFQAENPEALVIPLQQDYGADLAVLSDSLVPWALVEVKSSKIRRRALSAKLTPAEAALQWKLKDRYVVVRVLRIPGKPRDTFEVLSIGT